MSDSSFSALWRRYRHLSPDERRTLRQAVTMVPSMHVAVRVLGFNALQRWVAHTPVALGHWTEADALRISVVSINRVKDFSLLPGNCLSQSLALARLLRQRGVVPDLRLGARLTGPQLDAHAWVEYDGRVLNDTQDVGARFPPLSTARPDRRQSY